MAVLWFPFPLILVSSLPSPLRPLISASCHFLFLAGVANRLDSSSSFFQPNSFLLAPSPTLSLSLIHPPSLLLPLPFALSPQYFMTLPPSPPPPLPPAPSSPASTIYPAEPRARMRLFTLLTNAKYRNAIKLRRKCFSLDDQRGEDERCICVYLFLMY